MSRIPVLLLDLLSNSLLFGLIVPHIPVTSILALSSTSRAYNELLKSSPGTFRYLDLTGFALPEIDPTPIDYGGVAWRSQRMDESLTEDDFFSGPLRGLFYNLQQQNILKNVCTLILDGVDVTFGVLEEIVLDTTGRFNVRVLSVRQVQRYIWGGAHKISSIIRKAAQSGKAKGGPRLKAFYFFSSPRGFTSRGYDPVVAAEPRPRLVDEWYEPGPVFMLYRNPDWVKTIEEVKGEILFDAIVCRGPRHYPEWPAESFSTGRIDKALANHAMGMGCLKCGSAPEGPTIFGKSAPGLLPLLTPPPITPCPVNAAQKPAPLPDGTYPSLYARCRDCIKERQCTKCKRWICEGCADDKDRHLWIASYHDVVYDRVPRDFLHGHVYQWKYQLGRSATVLSSLLCLDRCMPTEFADRDCPV